MYDMACTRITFILCIIYICVYIYIYIYIIYTYIRTYTHIYIYIYIHVCTSSTHLRVHVVAMHIPCGMLLQWHAIVRKLVQCMLSHTKLETNSKRP